MRESSTASSGGPPASRRNSTAPLRLDFVCTETEVVKSFLARKGNYADADAINCGRCCGHFVRPGKVLGLRLFQAVDENTGQMEDDSNTIGNVKDSSAKIKSFFLLGAVKDVVEDRSQTVSSKS